MFIGRLIASMAVDTAQLEVAKAKMLAFEKTAQASMMKVTASLKAVGAAMKKFGRMASMYLTLPLALVGGAAFKMHKDFESSMTKIVGLVGVARGQVEQWGRDILKMAPELGKAPTELADALYFITSAGLRGAEAMEVLEMSAKASAVGLGETKVVADLVTSAMNAYGKANLSAAQATDILVATVREGKAEADSLAQAMGMVLPIASYMEVSFDQVGAAIAAMTRTGTNARTASMQLRQILNAIVKPTDQAAEALKDMKTSAAELRRTIREEGLLAALMKIRDLTKQYGEDTVATVFPNIRALSGVLDIMGANLEDNIKIFDKLSNSTGFLNAAFQEVAETTEFKWNRATARLKTSLTTFGKSVAEVIIPMMEGFAERIRKLTRWFDNLTEAGKRTTVKIMGLLAVVGPLSIALGVLVGSILPALLRAGMAVIKMFNLLRLAVLANPFTALMYAVMAVAGALTIFIGKAREAKEAQEDFNKITDQAMANTARQRVLVEQLFRIARDEKNALADREAAIKRLNQISPEYLGNLKLESINTKNATEAKQKYIDELIREAKVKAIQEELIELHKEMYKEVERGGALQVKWWQYVLGAIMPVGHRMRWFGDVSADAWEKAKKGYEDAEKALQDYLNTLIERRDFETKTDGGVDLGLDGDGVGAGVADNLKDIAAVTRRVAEEQMALATMTEVMGDDFDEASRRVSLYENALMELARLGLDAAHPSMVALKMALDDWSSSVKEGDDILDDFNAQLAVVDAKSQIFGDEFDALAAKITLYRQAIEALVDTKEDWVDVIDELIRKLRELEEQQKKNDEELEKGAVAKTIGEIANSVSGLGNAIAQAAEDSKVNFAEAMNIISQAALSTIGVLQALAAANIIAKETQKGLVGIFTAIAGISMLLAIWGAFVKPKKMAGGGVVPPGYPNDTFPALLTSGERVIPPGGAGAGTIKIEFGDAILEGDKLKWLIRRAEEKERITTG